MSYDRYYRLWADVDLDAIRSNIMQIQKLLHPGVMSCAVIKADAYGHGAIHVAGAVSDLVDYYAVATMDEAMELRNHGLDKPVLILGYVDPDLAAEAARNKIRLTVYDWEQARRISETVRNASDAVRETEEGELLRACVHIKVDTGMGRIGFRAAEEDANIITRIAELPGIRVEGLFTHFANSDGQTTDDAMQQLHVFEQFSDRLKQKGLMIPLLHCSNSAAATRIRAADHDMVRLGISMYGLYPSAYTDQITLTPALSLKSRVVMVKTVPAGFRVGYGSTWTAPCTSRIATIPVGYADGYFRSLSNRGYVLIGGARYPVAGRVCMDQIMADVTQPLERSETMEEVKQGSEAVLIGKSGDLQITMEEIADLAGSFNYEFACGLSLRVPRIYYRDGKYAGTRDLLVSN